MADHSLSGPYTNSRERALTWPQASGWALGGVAVLCALAVCAAALRHTDSLAFPIDDGYIYSNYVLSASQGHPFTYNAGETSGGITSPAWYLICTLFYWLVVPLHSLLGGIAPPVVRSNDALAQQAGHLFLAAYLPGVVCLAMVALGTRRLAELALQQPAVGRGVRTRQALCWLIGAVAGADLGLVWGALSGLEVALSAALVVWALCFLVEDVQRAKLRWSLLAIGLLPWVRPDLLAISLAGFAWLLLYSVFGSEHRERANALHSLALYASAVALGAGGMALFYFVVWGRALPSSFYAKVGGLRLGARFFSAADELVLAGRALPFVAAVTAVAGSVLGWVGGRHERRGLRPGSGWVVVLLLLTSAIYVISIMASLPWFGQEDRYLLPVHPIVVVQLGLLVWSLLRYAQIDRFLEGNRTRPALAVGAITVLATANYFWATRDYVVEVRNISDAHIKPALWLAANTPPGRLVVSEPIGAVKLYSGKPTIDLVGLTSPVTLGTYRDWPRAWPALKAAGGRYLLFYPNWFDNRRAPPWAVERARFDVPDNRIAGDSVIAIYELRWDLYKP